MKPLSRCWSLLVVAALFASGCSSSEPAPTGATREEAVEMHRETANREMQDIQRSRAEQAANEAK
jgi:hypothetical protein